MKFLKPQLLPLFTLVAGILGFLLRLLLSRTGIDEKGLLMADHYAGTLLLILTAIVLAVLFLGCRKLQNVDRYSAMFPASSLGLAGCILTAAGILYVGIDDLIAQQDNFSVVVGLFAIVCAVCLVVLGIYRKQGKQPGYLLHACLTVFLMIQLISEYRYWSPEPQLLLYFFPLLATVFLMLTAYQATCLDAGRGSRRWYVFANLAAVFFCCVSLPGDHWIFYLSMVLWAGTNLCSLQAFKNRKES